MKICIRPRSYITKIPFPQELEYGDHHQRDSLREDIVQIEEEFTEGLLGSVPGHNTWEVQALVAIELQVSPGKSGRRWEVGVIWRWG